MLRWLAFALDKPHGMDGKLDHRADRSPNGDGERKVSSQGPVRDSKSGSNSNTSTCTHTLPFQFAIINSGGQVAVLGLPSCLLNWVRC